MSREELREKLDWMNTYRGWEKQADEVHQLAHDAADLLDELDAKDQQIADLKAFIRGMEASGEHQRQRIAELEAENQRIHALYFGERAAHNSRGGA